MNLRYNGTKQDIYNSKAIFLPIYFYKESNNLPEKVFHKKGFTQ